VETALSAKRPLFWIIDDEWPDYSVETAELKAAYPDCEIKISGLPFDEDLAVYGPKADAVLAQITVDLNGDVIRQLTNCKGIAVFGSGYNNVDIKAAKECGIPVTNVNGYCSEDIADYVLAAIFHFYKRSPQLSENIGNGIWGAQALPGPVHRLSHQTLLLMGFGHIGKVTAFRAQALGMKVMAYDPFVPTEAISQWGVIPVSLEEGLAVADYVSVHVKLTEETKGLIGRSVFEKMKNSAILINVARGPLVKEDELIEAVEQGVIAGAVLDVVDKEPISPDSPLLKVKNILITPHISYASEDAIIDLRTRAVHNALTMYRGETPADLVR